MMVSLKLAAMDSSLGGDYSFDDNLANFCRKIDIWIDSLIGASCNLHEQVSIFIHCASCEFCIFHGLNINCNRFRKGNLLLPSGHLVKNS